MPDIVLDVYKRQVISISLPECGAAFHILSLSVSRLVRIQRKLPSGMSGVISSPPLYTLARSTVEMIPLRNVVPFSDST